MARAIPRPLRRLAHPRSRRSELWACVYCGAFETEPAASEESDTVRRRD